MSWSGIDEQSISRIFPTGISPKFAAWVFCAYLSQSEEKNALASSVLKAEAHAANPAEEIDESELMSHFGLVGRTNIAYVGLWSIGHKWTWNPLIDRLLSST